jgi:hypothetical protein
MKGKFVLAGLAGLLAAAPAFAQSGTVSEECTGLDARAVDACQKTVDVFGFMVPQLGVSLAGGNALLGARSNIGGLGHFSLGLRATAIQGKLPDFESINFSTTGAAQTEIDTEDQILGAPGVELAVGLFKGVDLGFARVGALEGIVSANYIPEYSDDNFTLEAPDGSLKLGFGGRLGLIGEGALLPGVAVTYLRRDLPTLDLRAITTGSLAGTADDSLGLENFSVKTTAIRAVVTKNVSILGLAAGIGQDSYDASADLNTVVRSGTTNCSAVAPCRANVSYAQENTRTTMFANATLNLLLFRLGAEIGQVSGGDIATYNTFADRDPNDSILFGSVAIRFGF